MANKRKRKSQTPTQAEQNEANEDAVTEARPSKSPTRPRKGPRPHVEIVEIDSDEEELEQLPRLTGVLRGLDTRDVITQTQPSVEIEDMDDDGNTKKSQKTRHGTRQTLYGKSEVNYDMEYHPMDVVTRPKRAAKRGYALALPDDDIETDEESLPSSARASDASSESNDSSEEEVELVLRIPDPKATRHSGRTHKVVEYSSKHHPQDYRLPGYQHKGKARKKLLEATRRSVSSTHKPGNRGSTIDLTNEATDEESVVTEQEEDELPTTDMELKEHNPRKKLRTLTDSRTRGPGRKTNLKRTEAEASSDVVNLLTSVNEPAILKGLTSSEAAEYLRLTQKLQKQDTQRPVEETNENDLPTFVNIRSSLSHNTRPDYDDNDDYLTMFAGHGHSADDDAGRADGVNDEMKGARTEDTATRKDSHRSQDYLPPSQFDEQFAVTEIKLAQPDEETPSDLLSGLEASLRNDMVPDEDVESNDMNDPSSTAEEDQYDTPNTSHGSNRPPRQHSASNHQETTPSDPRLTHTARNNRASQVEKWSSTAGNAESSPRDVDDNLLRVFDSSQRARSDPTMETALSSGNHSDETSDDHAEFE